MIGVDDEPMTAEERDREMAIALQRQLALEQQGGGAGAAVPVLNQNVLGRLTITVVEAKLTKNYGVTRMDPYARLRVGHNVYETPTVQNGAREPKWNKTINCFLMAGSKTIDVEIYEECTFSPDSLIAHSSIPLTDRVIVKGEMVDDWYVASEWTGRRGEGGYDPPDPVHASNPNRECYPPSNQWRGTQCVRRQAPVIHHILCSHSSCCSSSFV